MKTRSILAALAMFAAPVGAEPIKVTGFSYEWPKELEKTPALVSYLKNDKAKQYKSYAELFTEQPTIGAPLSSYDNTTNWKLKTTLPGLIILVGLRGEFTGGAHGYGYMDSLIWDTRSSAAVPFSRLFTKPRAAEALLTPLYCRALDKEREAKRGEPTPRDDLFGDCPKLFESGKIWPDKPVYGKFSRISMSFGPYAVGPYAEGIYDLEIVIPKGLKALVKPQYRALFPG